MKITNIAKGPRGFWHGGTLTIVPPGATVEHELDAEALAGVKGNKESFKFEEPKEAKKDDEGAPKSAKEALALFSAEGVHVNTAKAKAKAFLGDKVADDASKDDIVAKLEELAKAEG